MPLVMKKYVAIFFLIVFHTTFCFSQNLISEDKLWSNVTFGTENPDIYKSSYWIKFQGDTTINNVQYKKILQADDSLHSDWYLNGFIREDIVAQKVYLFNNYTESDQLLYDFSLEKGDSILIWDGLTFAKIDTILYEPFGNSKDTVKQICFNKGCTHRWIKGIGSTRGVLNGLNTIMTVGAYYNLVCYYENDKLIYHNSQFDTCFPDSTTVSISMFDDKKKIEIFPNPAKNKITIYSQSGKISEVKIYDLTGTCLYQNLNINSNRIDLKTDNFSKGMYILKVKDEQDENSHKIIIQ
jgi:hypothetical protein